MTYRLVRELADEVDLEVDVAVACRVLGVSRSGYYEWRDRPASARAAADADLVETIRAVHEGSRRTYGSPRVHAELVLGLDVRCGRKRVARLVAAHGLVGVGGKRKTRHRPDTATHEDLVQRRFTAEAPDRLWCTDITEHPTAEGKVYCCAESMPSWTSTTGWWWAGRSPTTCDQSWSSTPSRWPAGSAARSPGRSCTQTAEANTPAGCSASASGSRGYSGRWVGSPHRWTTA